jgi:hypothetical protein
VPPQGAQGAVVKTSASFAFARPSRVTAPPQGAQGASPDSLQVAQPAEVAALPVQAVQSVVGMPATKGPTRPFALQAPQGVSIRFWPLQDSQIRQSRQPLKPSRHGFPAHTTQSTSPVALQGGQFAFRKTPGPAQRVHFTSVPAGEPGFCIHPIVWQTGHGKSPRFLPWQVGHVVLPSLQARQ